MSWTFLKRWGSAIMPSLWKCNSLSHSWVDNSTQPHTNTFFTFFCHHIWYTFHVWSSPSSSNTASISTCAKPFPFNISAQHNGQIAISKWPLSLQSPPPPPPLYLSHWWELDATPAAVAVSSLIDVWYSEVVISAGWTRGCHLLWLL